MRARTPNVGPVHMKTGDEQDVRRIISSLTKEEKAVLLAANESGDLHKFTSDNAGDWVGGRQDLTDPKNPAFAISHLEALATLVAKRLIMQETKDHYHLTSLGFKVRAALSPTV